MALNIRLVAPDSTRSALHNGGKNDFARDKIVKKSFLIPAFCDCVYLDSDDDNLTIILLITMLATQNLLMLMCTTTYQNLGEIGVTPNESNGPESNGPSAGVTITKFVCGLNLMRTRWIR